MFIVDFMSNQIEHSDFLCLLLIIYFIIRISFFNYLAKILLGQPLFGNVALCQAVWLVNWCLA